VDNTYYDEKIETLAKRELQELQFKRLKTIVNHCYVNSSFYKKKFDTLGLKPTDIKSLEDLRKIPFTVKTDLRDNYPLGMMAAKISEVVEIHASSGTTGNPIIGPYTSNDIKNWKELMARTIYAAGGRKSDVIHNAYGYGLFTGGLGCPDKRWYDSKTNKINYRSTGYNSLLYSQFCCLFG